MKAFKYLFFIAITASFIYACKKSTTKPSSSNGNSGSGSNAFNLEGTNWATVDGTNTLNFQSGNKVVAKGPILVLSSIESKGTYSSGNIHITSYKTNSVLSLVSPGLSSWRDTSLNYPYTLSNNNKTLAVNRITYSKK